jgi:hypothetical protein
MVFASFEILIYIYIWYMHEWGEKKKEMMREREKWFTCKNTRTYVKHIKKVNDANVL